MNEFLLRQSLYDNIERMGLRMNLCPESTCSCVVIKLEEVGTGQLPDEDKLNEFRSLMETACITCSDQHHATFRYERTAGVIIQEALDQQQRLLDEKLEAMRDRFRDIPKTLRCMVVTQADDILTPQT